MISNSMFTKSPIFLSERLVFFIVKGIIYIMIDSLLMFPSVIQVLEHGNGIQNLM